MTTTPEQIRIEELSKLSLKELISIGKQMCIKYLTHLKKEDIIVEIIGAEFSSWESDILLNEKREQRKRKSWICEHNKQKYKCVLCGGSHICKHKKQKQSCKKCRLELKGLIDIH